MARLIILVSLVQFTIVALLITRSVFRQIDLTARDRRRVTTWRE